MHKSAYLTIQHEAQACTSRPTLLDKVPLHGCQVQTNKVAKGIWNISFQLYYRKSSYTLPLSVRMTENDETNPINKEPVQSQVREPEDLITSLLPRVVTSKYPRVIALITALLGIFRASNFLKGITASAWTLIRGMTLKKVMFSLVFTLLSIVNYFSIKKRLYQKLVTAIDLLQQNPKRYFLFAETLMISLTLSQRIILNFLPGSSDVKAQYASWLR